MCPSCTSLPRSLSFCTSCQWWDRCGVAGVVVVVVVRTIPPFGWSPVKRWYKSNSAWGSIENVCPGLWNSHLYGNIYEASNIIGWDKCFFTQWLEIFGPCNYFFISIFRTSILCQMSRVLNGTRAVHVVGNVVCPQGSTIDIWYSFNIIRGKVNHCSWRSCCRAGIQHRHMWAKHWGKDSTDSKDDHDQVLEVEYYYEGLMGVFQNKSTVSFREGKWTKQPC